MDPMNFTGGSPTDATGGGYSDPFAGMPVKDALPEYASATPEVSQLRVWEDKHEQELEEKSRAEQAEKNSRRSAAADEINKWNEERKGNIAKKHATNRSD